MRHIGFYVGGWLLALSLYGAGAVLVQPFAHAHFYLIHKVTTPYHLLSPHKHWAPVALDEEPMEPKFHLL